MADTDVALTFEASCEINVDVTVGYLGQRNTLRNIGYNRAVLSIFGEMLLQAIGLGANVMSTKTQSGSPVLHWARAHESAPPVDEMSSGQPNPQPLRTAFFHFNVDLDYLENLPPMLYEISIEGHPSHAADLKLMGFPVHIKMRNPVPEPQRYMGKSLLNGTFRIGRQLPYTETLTRS